MQLKKFYIAKPLNRKWPHTPQVKTACAFKKLLTSIKMLNGQTLHEHISRD